MNDSKTDVVQVDSDVVLFAPTASYALVDDDEPAELGTCDMCGQDLIRTPTDCWHPYGVARACPPEPGDDWSQDTGWPAFYRQYRGPGRPGREHFQPAERGVEWTVQS